MKSKPIININGTQTDFRTIWLSDIHLGNKDCHAEKLLQFLDAVQAKKIFLVGDIVDMLALKSRMYWPKSHAEVLDKIYHLSQSGVEVIYVPGNHDIPMRRYESGLLSSVRIECQTIHETLQGKRLLVVHGDEFDHAVLYKTLNRVIGSSAYGLATFLNRTVASIRQILGLRYWSFANYLKENISQARKAIKDFELAAVAEVRQRKLDGIVCGHIHKPQLREIDGILYCNDGDWTESCSALIETHSGELQLMEWSEIEQMIESKSFIVTEAA